MNFIYFDLGKFFSTISLELFPYNTKSKRSVPLPCDFLKSTMLAGTVLPRIYQWKITF